MARTDAVVYILLGQSNAVGHGIPMAEEDKIKVPMRNVFGLHREDNQSYDGEKLTWRGYLSAGMNLAETQDDTYSVANCLARSWQKAIDQGEDLPDLYIVQIAIGAQGVTGNYMWNPNYERILVPGKLGTVKMALYPFTCHILSLIPESFRAMGKTYEIMGIHWRGGENDNGCSPEHRATIKGIYEAMFSDFRRALGETAPIVLHRIVSSQRSLGRDPSGYSFRGLLDTNRIFDELAEEWENVSVFNPQWLPIHKSGLLDQGLYKSDFVHFTPEANQQVADWTMGKYLRKL